MAVASARRNSRTGCGTLSTTYTQRGRDRVTTCRAPWPQGPGQRGSKLPSSLLIVQTNDATGSECATVKAPMTWKRKLLRPSASCGMCRLWKHIVVRPAESQRSIMEASNGSALVPALSAVIKPANDTREYRIITLPNGLQVCACCSPVNSHGRFCECLLRPGPPSRFARFC